MKSQTFLVVTATVFCGGDSPRWVLTRSTSNAEAEPININTVKIIFVERRNVSIFGLLGIAAWFESIGILVVVQPSFPSTSHSVLRVVQF